MKIAILETILMPAGHESEFDKILVDEIKKTGNEVCFFVPKDYPFKMDYKCSVYHLKSQAISYANVSKFKKIFLSILREIRKIAWLNEAANLAKQGLVDAILIPTCSYRMLKSVRLSKFKNSSVPILLILHGIMPKDKAKFIHLAKKLGKFKNIKFANLGLQEKFDELKNDNNFFTILPPVYTPYLLENTQPTSSDTLKFGFFGQYRKEKNLEFILESFCNAKFNRPTELIVQGSTPTKDDEIDFKRLQNKYLSHKNIKFIHKSLIGKEWQEALMSVDVLLIPYGATRYLYQPSAMLFTAIGFNKPILQSELMSPEILGEFKIGEFVDLSNTETFAKQLSNFANEFENKIAIYKNALKNAATKYSGKNLANQIVKILSI